MNRTLVAAASVGLAVLAGCAATPSPVVTVSAGSSAPAGENPVVSVSRTKVYSSLKDLLADSTLVVHARVLKSDQQPADRAGQGPVMASVASVEVEDVLKGSSPARQLNVRVITAASDASEVPPEVRAGQDLVLFLQPFEWEPGVATDEWTVAGGAGIYEIDAGAINRLSRGPDEIPSKFTALSDLRETLGKA